MNLRYYLRGLGIGIIVTAIIMSFTSGKGRMTSPANEQVPAAEAQEKNSGVLADLELEQEEEPAESLPTAQISQEPDNIEEPDDIEEPDQEPEAGDAKAPDSEEEPEDTAPEEPEEDQMSDQDKEEGEAEGEEAVPPEGEAEQPAEAQEGGSVVFEIFQGDNSYTVSMRLEEAGLIASASVFDRYLYDNGYDRKLRFGTYEIPVDTAPEEIAAMLTGIRR